MIDFKYMGRLKCYDRETLLEKATQVFWRQGYADTSLQDLEKATGVNKSGLYSEFQDKQEIFLECITSYSNKSQLFEVLSAKPLGWKNIEDFLNSGNRCTGQKGCFLANSVREFSILPKKTKAKILEHMNHVRDLVVENLKAETNASTPEILAKADLILTFNSGLALRLNVGEVSKYEHLVKTFLERLK